MLTAEENDLLCRVEGDAPMGQLMRRYWMPACMIEEVAAAGRPSGARAHAGRGPRGLSRHHTAASACSANTVRTAALRCCSAATRNAACAASITAGRWTSTATCSRSPSEPPESPLPQKVKHIAYPTREAGGFVWVYMGPPADMPEFEVARVRADRGHARGHRQGPGRLQLGADSRRRDRLGAQLEPAFDGHSAGQRRADRGGGRCVGATDQRQIAAHPGPAHQLRNALRGDPAADCERGDQRLCADHDVRRADHRAHSAQQRVQPGQRQRADGRHAHDVLFHRVEQLGPGRRHRTRFANSAARGSASISTTAIAASGPATTISCRIARR